MRTVIKSLSYLRQYPKVKAANITETLSHISCDIMKNNDLLHQFLFNFIPIFFWKMFEIDFTKYQIHEIQNELFNK